MPLCLTTEIEGLAAAVTGRERSLFQGDIERHRDQLRRRVAGKRILIAGGAGSIASATIRELLPLEPAALAILDPSENNAVELLRWVRSGPYGQADLSIQPLDYGSPLASAWLARQRPFDLVLAFAALKHVRSERDVFSLLRMAEVNILGADRFCTALRRHGHGAGGVFFVSTDKAARPTSLMGATKRVMEAVCWFHRESTTDSLLSPGGDATPLSRMTSTRFANVAFSDGSLPWGYLQRLAKGQPLAGPVDVRRFLVSPAESGQLCLLASQIVPDGHLGIPVLNETEHTVAFDSIAEQILASRGLKTVPFSDDQAARLAAEELAHSDSWPFVGTRSDTSGEKVMEEFLAEGETAVDCDCTSVQAVPGQASDVDELRRLLQRLDAFIQGHEALPDKAALVDAFSRLIPDIGHRETGTSLDRKM
jgi:FlaA1/EpsC-like NDP-sugar epimerase